MKVIAINGSARKEGNTTILVQKVFDELEEGVSLRSRSTWQARRLRGVSPVLSVSRTWTEGALSITTISTSASEKWTRLTG